MLSIIIPTYNEEMTIRKLLRFILFEEMTQDVEVIVVDGGSTDGTCELVEGFESVKLVRSARKGRSVQMHLGAKMARGKILYFLHADSVPPSGFANEIREAVANGKHTGCFRMCFDSKNMLLGCFCWFVRFPQLIFRGGDQSLFMTSDLYSQVKGFNTRMLIMEDIEIIKRLKKVSRFHVLKGCLTTSARKYKRNGVVRLQLIFGLIHCFYFMGCSQEMLWRFYSSRVK